jgi:hypothetical protein
MNSTAPFAPAAALVGRRKRRENWAEKLLSPAHALTVFAIVLVIVYAVVPTLVYLLLVPVGAFVQLGAITAASVAAMMLGAKLPLFDSRFAHGALRLRLDPAPFNATIWFAFALFLIVTFATAPTVPLISALFGQDDASLSQERGDFLKGREGAGIALLYISTFLVNTVVPYSIVLLFATRSRWRFAAALVFFLFCVSFLQKALFLNLVLPLLAFAAATRRVRGRTAALAILGSAGMLVLGVALTQGGESGSSDGSRNAEDFLSAVYGPSGAVDYFLWRAFAVPIFTATDTLVVHAEQFGGRPLLGATSSFLSTLFGLERINLERFVFEHQFGSWNEIANSNAVFVVDAFVNFGWIGVVFFGLFVGQVFRWFSLSRDIGFRSLWPLFAFVLFSSPLIGMLLSNGFLYMLAHGLFVRVDRRSVNVSGQPRPGRAR